MQWSTGILLYRPTITLCLVTKGLYRHKFKATLKLLKVWKMQFLIVLNLQIISRHWEVLKLDKSWQSEEKFFKPQQSGHFERRRVLKVFSAAVNVWWCRCYLSSMCVSYHNKSILPHDFGVVLMIKKGQVKQQTNWLSNLQQYQWSKQVWRCTKNIGKLEHGTHFLFIEHSL